MTRKEWHQWKKRLDPNYKIPSTKEDAMAQQQEVDDDRNSKRDSRNKAEEDEAQRQREFAAFYNHT